MTPRGVRALGQDAGGARLHALTGEAPSPKEAVAAKRPTSPFSVGNGAETRVDRGPPPDTEDRTLITAVAAGDRRAFRVLYDRYAARLGRYVSRLVRQREDIDEVMNDVMLVVWQTAARFDPKRSLCAWLLGIAHRKALKAFMASARRSGRELRIAPADPECEPCDETQDLERDALETDVRRVIGRALQELSPEYRAVIELCFYEGFSYEEVAGVLGCATNTVKTRIFRARRQLARALADLGPNHLRR